MARCRVYEFKGTLPTEAEYLIAYVKSKGYNYAYFTWSN